MNSGVALSNIIICNGTIVGTATESGGTFSGGGFWMASAPASLARAAPANRAVRSSRVYRVPAMQILAISGSLRAGSSNTELLRAAALLAAPAMHVTLYRGLADLPAFNPDRMENAPPAVLSLREQIGAADGLLISSPEYGHGVPGALKNALDWLFSGEEMMAKPVAIFNASPLSTFADASLRETITVMSARLVTEASITIPTPIRNLDAAGLAAIPEVATALRAALVAFTKAISARSEPRGM